MPETRGPDVERFTQTTVPVYNLMRSVGNVRNRFSAWQSALRTLQHRCSILSRTEERRLPPPAQAGGFRRRNPMTQRGRRKHVPQRTCVACRAVRSKRDLIRIVRTPEGQVVVDERGKQNGRGAYLCAQAACWDETLLRKRLGAALRITLGDSEVAVLREVARSLPEQGLDQRARSGSEGNEEGV